MGAAIVKDGYPFILSALAIVAFGIFFNIHQIGYAFLLIAAFFTYFFRNPSRAVPQQKNILVSPADGRIKSIIQSGKYREIYIFIGPLDVHINRAPISGLIEHIQHRYGRHKMAFRKSAMTDNEENYIEIKSGKLKVTVVQVVGFLARRIRCWVGLHEKVERGQPIGMLLFGSGTRIIMPANAKILVREGQILRAGETIIAKI